jgi:hypothetical protein
MTCNSTAVKYPKLDISTCMHTYIHTYIRTYVHTYVYKKMIDIIQSQTTDVGQVESEGSMCSKYY